MNQGKVISIALIIISGLVVYANSFNSDFIWDDKFLVRDNTYIKSWSNISKIFTGNLIGGSGRKSNFYRPIQTLTYLIDYSFWKLNKKGYHFTNTFLHILVALTIYWFINILFKDNLLSLLTSIFFVVHPVHTEAVSYISGRADPLAALFMLLCFIFYVKYHRLKDVSLYVFSILSFMLALLCRENSLILPVLLLLYHYTFKEKLNYKKFLPITGVAVGYVFLRFTLLKPLLYHISSGSTLFQRIPGFFVAITNYLKLLFLPLDLHMEYGNKLFNLFYPQVITGIIVVFLLFIYCFRKQKSNKLIFFSICWFFIALIPVSNIYPINNYMAEHWLYLPSIGFFLLIAKFLGSIYNTKKAETLAMIFIIVLLAFYSGLTIKQNSYWKDPILFYERTLKYVPRSARIYNNLGEAKSDIGKNKEAVDLLKKAIEIKPNYAEAYNNLGIVYKNMGKNKQAFASYQKAIKINPNFADAYYNIGVLYTTSGNRREARISYEKALEMNPELADAYYNLGVIHAESGEYDKAIESYKKAIERNPSDAASYCNLGVIYIKLGKYNKAVKLFEKVIKVDQNYAVIARSNLAILYSKMGQHELAAEQCDILADQGHKVPRQLLKLRIDD